MPNVQLTGGEATVVYTDLDTGRILAFGPVGARPVVPAGTRYQSELLAHASDIERWSRRYQIQCQRDRDEAAVNRLESERPFRAALKSAILERNNQLDPWNRDINLRMIEAQDKLYERILESRRKAEVCIVAEKYTADSDSVKMAMDSPLITPRSNG